jgi:hypothetical protein
MASSHPRTLGATRLIARRCKALDAPQSKREAVLRLKFKRSSTLKRKKTQALNQTPRTNPNIQSKSSYGIGFDCPLDLSQTQAAGDGTMAAEARLTGRALCLPRL